MRWERDGNPHSASLEAIQARRAAFAQKLAEGAIIHCDEDLQPLENPPIIFKHEQDIQDIIDEQI